MRVDGVRVDGACLPSTAAAPMARSNVRTYVAPIQTGAAVGPRLPQVRAEGWAFIGGLRVRDPDFLKLAFKGLLGLIGVLS